MSIDTLPALTVCQPYASLLMLPASDPAVKLVENRVWETSYRGPLVIHAGQSRRWLATYWEPLPDQMPFGVLLGVVDLVACFHWRDIDQGKVPDAYRWLKTHKHTEGPWCWVVANPRKLAAPIPYKGLQKLWRVPRSLVADVLENAA